jgi:hypothetical protein
VLKKIKELIRIRNQAHNLTMPAMTSLMTTKDCMDTLVNLYEKHAPSQKRTLKHRLKYLKIEKGESVASFCSNLVQFSRGEKLG